MAAGRFLSTPSARRATLELTDEKKPIRISIHALREEGDYALPSLYSTALKFLSTPSVRRATGQNYQIHYSLLFLSTPSVRRATRLSLYQVQAHYISIHALREEGDVSFHMES